MIQQQKKDGISDVVGSTKDPLPRSVWVLSFVSFFADISSEMMVPLLPLFLVGALGSSEIELGFMEGAAVLICFADVRLCRLTKRSTWSPRWPSAMVELGIWCYALVSYPVGVLSDRGGRWRVIGLGWGIYVLVYLAFAWLPRKQSWGVWPLMSVYGLYMALTEGVGKALIAQYAPSAYRGTAMGVFHAITGITTFVASLLAGWLWQVYGSSVALSAGAFFAGLALVVLGWFAISDRTGT